MQMYGRSFNRKEKVAKLENTETSRDHSLCALSSFRRHTERGLLDIEEWTPDFTHRMNFWHFFRSNAARFREILYNVQIYLVYLGLQFFKATTNRISRPRHCDMHSFIFPSTSFKNTEYFYTVFCSDVCRHHSNENYFEHAVCGRESYFEHRDRPKTINFRKSE